MPINPSSLRLVILSALLLAAPLPGLEPDDAATPWRWIGAKSEPEGPCPQPSGSWSVRPLFGQGDGSPIPPGLRRFCVYESDPPGAPSALTFLVDSGQLSGVEPDHMAIGGLAHELKTAIWQDLRDHFLEQAGVAAWPTSTMTPSRLTVLDTGATNYSDPEIYPGNSPHGYTLVNMAKDLLCGDAGCLARVAARLALACLDFDPKSYALSCGVASGGIIGTISDLARATYLEVRNWQTTAADDHLVLNLSLGWDRVFGGDGGVASMSLDVQAVHAATSYSVCLGALVIAAAGNTGGGPDPETGPLYPGGWEQLPAPDFQACAEMLGETPPKIFPPSGSSAYRPLVYAVGGLEADGDPLANARPEGMPRLAAFADHAVVGDADENRPTAVLTGSSVAVVVVSAAAAAVWSYRPEIEPFEVMDIVYGAGDVLDRNADFCLGGSATNPCPDAVRRASVCAAVADACAAGQGSCPQAADLPECPAWSGAAVDLSRADLEAFIASAVPVNLDDVDQPYPETPECGGETLLYDVTHYPADPCPHRQYFGLETQLWTAPQPGSDPCSSCWMETSYADGGTGTLYLEIDSDFVGTLTDPTLIIGSATYNLGLAAGLSAGDQVEVVNVPDPGGSPVSLSFALDGGGLSVTSQVLAAE